MLLVFCVLLFASCVPDVCLVSGSYWLDGSSCSFEEGCYLSTEEDGCLNTCLYGYYWNTTDEDCYPCSESDASLCPGDDITACFDGYYLDDTSCLSCSTGCTVCTDDTHCTSCSASYALYGGECWDCTIEHADAATCTYDGAYTITSCRTGYGVVDNDCELCTNVAFGGNSGGAVCEESTSTPGKFKITECAAGYCLWENGDTDADWKCNNAGYPVLDCTYDQPNDKVTATECEESYGLCTESGETADTLCWSLGTSYATEWTLDANCLNPVVTECYGEGSYTVLQGSICEVCGELCETCTFDEGAKCTSCYDTEPYYDGYYSNGVICEPCSTGCHTCTDSTTCTECVDYDDFPAGDYAACVYTLPTPHHDDGAASAFSESAFMALFF